VVKNIHVIINPASGQDYPILNTLNHIFSKGGVEWDVSLTKQAGDGRKLAELAAEKGVDTLAVYGGDGTVVEAASGLVGTDIPLAILPGGTANMLALELGIPKKLAEAGQLIINEESQLRPVDMGLLDDSHYFINRIGVGLDAEMIQATTRELKDKFGVAAYVLGGFLALKKPVKARYRLTLDSQEIDREGVFCLISNTGKIGISDLKTFKNMDAGDGLLDVIIFQNTHLRTIRSRLINSVHPKRTAEEEKAEIWPVDHWQAKHIMVRADPPQLMHIDGDVSGQTPNKIEVIPQAVRILVPPEQTER
jgi:YegS/Rv2252/BmrU family lipid kinase